MEYEDRLRIATPEGVELDLTLAGIGSRFIASVIDHAIQGLLIAAGIALLLGIGSIGREGTQVEADASGGDIALGVAIITLFAFAVVFLYDVLFEVKGGGRTPGKRATGLRVVRTGGRPVGFVASATRNVLRLVDILPGFYGLAMAVIFASPRNQRLGDIAAGTVVVRERKGGRAGGGGGAAPAEPSRWADSGLDTSDWDVSGVTAEEIATVRRFLERRTDLASAPRASLAADLAARLSPRVAGAPEHAAPEDFLEALSAAKAARTAP